MKTAIIFSRCSSSGALEARQDTTRQVEDLQRYATTNHLTIVKIFQEHISGGKSNKDRPILQEALSFCQGNSINIILVSELSRLGRRCDEILETIKLLPERTTLYLWYWREGEPLSHHYDSSIRNGSRTWASIYLLSLKVRQGQVYQGWWEDR